MTWISLLFAQVAIGFLLFGSERGKRIFFEGQLTRERQNFLKFCGTTSLCFSLLLQLFAVREPVLDIIQWIMGIAIEIIVAALLCALWEKEHNRFFRAASQHLRK
ncbi:hypothetical protein [Gluconobacter kanchanaburiensis]|uniref:hypothetical protein n=1 Tax=Gluconobacter kanchanaburiensis TaxID=563199 RepID=UPI0011BF5E0D|nr:hypothetical protein [Gluconobacter kanchanaburiensis]MBF0862632.1 hypothetical protein [Gluconobacter kanchanaburiensis]